jgi:hypothetical protein
VELPYSSTYLTSAVGTVSGQLQESPTLSPGKDLSVAIK